MDVPVRVEDDTVLVGASPSAPAGAGLVRLHGADLILDPTAPDDPLHLRVSDLDDAGTAVELLHGPAVAAAVERVADGGPAELVAAEAVADGGIARGGPRAGPAALARAAQPGPAARRAARPRHRDDGRRARRPAHRQRARRRRRPAAPARRPGRRAERPAARRPVPAAGRAGNARRRGGHRDGGRAAHDSPLHDALTHETELARAVHALGGSRPTGPCSRRCPGSATGSSRAPCTPGGATATAATTMSSAGSPPSTGCRCRAARSTPQKAPSPGRSPTAPPPP